MSGWKRAGAIPFFSADRAVTRMGEHPISFWPEAFGLPASERPRVVPAILRPVKKHEGAPVVRAPRESARPRLPPGAIGDSQTRVMLAVLGGSVSISELSEATGITRSTVSHHLDALREEGLVDWIPNRARTLRPIFGVSARGGAVSLHGD